MCLSMKCNHLQKENKSSTTEVLFRVHVHMQIRVYDGNYIEY